MSTLAYPTHHPSPRSNSNAISSKIDVLFSPGTNATGIILLLVLLKSVPLDMLRPLNGGIGTFLPVLPHKLRIVSEA